jgi:hypothetical protein
MSIYNFYSIYLPAKREEYTNWYVNSLHKKTIKMNMYFHFTKIKSTDNLYSSKNYNNYSQNQVFDYKIAQVLQDINLKQWKC